MPTDLPYAADAEESLAFDELEVRVASVPFFASSLDIDTDDQLSSCAGASTTVLEGRRKPPYYYPDQIQLW